MSPSSIAYNTRPSDSDKQLKALKCAKIMIADSYDNCSCASGKKYKFCCKKIFREISEAMAALATGKITEALQWIAQAKKNVGETAEVLCRESIIYSSDDPEKSNNILNRCLKVNPRHPRAHYLRGINFKEQGDFQAAIEAYETAIANYPPSDHYHLNETYNNLGGVFNHVGEMKKAKSAWEKALLYLPDDDMAQNNLNEFIYTRDTT